jgi:signal transduction histidine kinase
LTATVVTVVVSTASFVRLGYENPSAHVAIETATALVASIASYLVFLRFRRSSLWSDLMLASALAVLAATNLFFLAGPSAFAPAATGTGFVWAAVAGSVLGAAVLAVAAFTTARPLRRPRTAALATGLALVGALTVAAAAAFALEDRLPLGIDPGASPDAATWPNLTGNVALLVLQGGIGAAWAFGAVGFTRRAAATADELTFWVAIACVLAAFARVNYVLFPSLYTDWVFTGDILRAAAYACLAVGAVREVSVYNRQLADMAVLEERRRLARDFHDGLAQELAFIVAYGRKLAETSGEPAAARVVAAAERALDEARRAINALTRRIDAPLDAALADTAAEIAQRAGARVELDLAPDVRVSSAAQEALVRVVREAVTNAVRHGHASTVQVHLDEADGIHLRIEDDGRGFDLSQAATDGRFGLTSMAERTRALGGELRIESHVGGGTAVEVTLP